MRVAWAVAAGVLARCAAIDERRRPCPSTDKARFSTVAVESAVTNPAVDRVAPDAQLARQGALARAVLEMMPE
jgi:hypothetical protein